MPALRIARGIIRTLVEKLSVALVITAGSVSCLGNDADHMLRVLTRQTNGVTHFFVQNLEAANVTTTFDLQLQNLQASSQFPLTTTIPGHQTVEAFTLSPVDQAAPVHYSYRECFTVGTLNAVHDDSYVYALPYAPGKSFRVSQGYHGKFSHSGQEEFAIDWKMPAGTPVYAAREGVVVKCKADSDKGGSDKKYETAANCVMVQHADGTIGLYAHLQKDGVKVKVGDVVKVGDWIALSGNTGYTSGPHLHFSVFKTVSGRERQSIPIRFRSADHGVDTLASGQSYQAAPVADHAIATGAPTESGRTRGGG